MRPLVLDGIWHRWPVWMDHRAPDRNSRLLSLARSARQGSGEKLVFHNNTRPHTATFNDRAGLERSDFAVRRLPLIFALK